MLHELGHALGLGHSGPYNGSVPSNSQVIYTTDNRQYSIMSYVDAGSATASAVATRNGDTPSAANYQNGNGTFYLTTPGQYDILAIQRLYGVASSGPLTTGETFGFNASAALTSSLPMFDFTINTNPVVTLYDFGTGNTLDLSGFSATSIVDLNPGQFSSVNGMVDNIGIDFSTWIDTAIGGAGNDTFYVNAQDDTIDGGDGTDTVVFSGDHTAYTLSRTATQVIVIGSGATDTLAGVETLQFADMSIRPAASTSPVSRGGRVCARRPARCLSNCCWPAIWFAHWPGRRGRSSGSVTERSISWPTRTRHWPRRSASSKAPSAQAGLSATCCYRPTTPFWWKMGHSFLPACWSTTAPSSAKHRCAR